MEDLTKTKPKVKLTGTNGNTLALASRCADALKRAGQREEARALPREVMTAGSYDEALQVMMKYCDVY